MVANVHPLKGLGTASGGVTEAVKYLRDQKAAEAASHYYKDGAATAQWGGKLAAHFGLKAGAEVDDKALAALMSGADPRTGEVLIKKGRKDRRLADEIVFAPPKSFSVLVVALGHENAFAFHKEAVRRAMSHVEDNFAAARYGTDGREVERTGQMVWAAFTHTDSRPVKGGDGSEVAAHLHDHVACMNMTVGRDGEIRGQKLAFGADDIKLVGAVYDSEYAALLREAGIGLRQSEHGVEIAAVGDDVLAATSLRRIQMDAYCRQHYNVSANKATSAQLQAAQLATKEAKLKTTDRDQEAWFREQVTSLGLTREAIDASHTPPASREERAAAARAAVQDALDHFSERDSVITLNGVRREALKFSRAHGVRLTEVDKAIEQMQAEKHIYKASDKGDSKSLPQQRIVTREALDREARILQRARAGRGAVTAIATADVTAAHIIDTERAQGFQFSQGQRDAIALALAGKDQVQAIVGAAGAGKTTAMAAVVSLANHGGLETIGLAPSNAAVKELTSAGAQDNRTIASFVLQKPDPTAAPRLIVLDEAGMVSAKDMDAVMGKLRPQDRVLLVGDPKQLHAVEAGKPFGQMLNSGAVRRAEIMEINRQKNADQLAMAQAFASGQSERGVELAKPFMREIQVQKIDGEKPEDLRKRKRDELVKATAGQVLALTPEERSKTLTLAATNAVRRALNSEIRAGLQARGEVGADLGLFAALDKRDLTGGELKRAGNYHPGDVVRWPDRRGEKSYVVEAADPSSGTLTLRVESGDNIRKITAAELAQKRPQVFTVRDMPLAQGDRVLFTAAAREQDITNGQEAEVIGLNKDGRLIARLDTGAAVEIDPEKAHALDHGYAVTAHRSQGRTVERAIVAGAASRVATAELAYVSVTRQKLELQIVTDDREKLGKSWSRFSDKQTAREGIGREETEKADPLAAARAEAMQRVETQAQQQASTATQKAPERERERDREMEMGR